MGEVYRARDPRLERDVAIKVLPQEVMRDSERLRRFRQEAKATGALNHPNILAIHDVGSHQGVPFVVTELLEGETLRACLADRSIPIREAVEYGEQIARGLAAAHGKGIVHRDLKPSNLFITKDGRVKILDFGLAKVIVEEQATVSNAQTASLMPRTEPGVVLGTVGYMSPEQVRARSVDHRSDIFSLGAVLYEMVWRRRAFKGKSAADTMSMILSHDPPRSASSGGGEVPPELQRIIMRCLSKRPEKRFQSALDLAFALKGLSSGRMTPVIEGAGQKGKRPAIAVLPFVNLSADPEQEYFCDGVAEEIINALVHVERLRVIARTSSFAFKGKSEDIREIGTKLAVQNLLEGSVRRAGNRLRITAQLINVADGSHLWSEHFDRKLEDIFAIQDEIALAVAENLRVKLLREERAAIVRRRTTDVEANNAFLKGRHYWSSFTPEGFARSREYFAEAIEIDPGFATAYAMMAGWHMSQSMWGDVPPGETVSIARSLAEKALAIDEGNAHALAVMGGLRGMYEADGEVGVRLLRQSVALAPNDAFMQINLAIVLSMRESHEEAMEHVQIAHQLDPLSPNINAWTAGILVECGRVEEGVDELEKLVALMPRFWLAHYELARAYQSSSRLAEARAPGEKGVELSAGRSMATARLACICYQAGDTSRGDEVLEQLKKRSEEAYVAPSILAWVHMARGANDQAARLLEQAREIKDPMFVATRVFTRPFFPSGSAVDAILKKAGW